VTNIWTEYAKLWLEGEVIRMGKEYAILECIREPYPLPPITKLYWNRWKDEKPHVGRNVIYWYAKYREFHFKESLCPYRTFGGRKIRPTLWAYLPTREEMVG